MTNLRIQIEAREALEMTQRAQRMQGAKLGLAVAAVHLQGQIARYPRRRAMTADEVWSKDPVKREKQRKGFFRRLKKGLIEVPYRRGLSSGSQKLGQSWTTAASNGGFKQTVGTRVTYARKVQSTRYQTRFHKVTGWGTVEDVIKRETPRLIDIVTDYVERDL